MATQTGSYDFKADKASHDALQAQLDPIASKSYTGLIGSANDAANASFYFAKIHPTSYNMMYRVAFRIIVTAPAQYEQIISASVCGFQNAFRCYDSISNRSASLAVNYINLYRAKQAGITNGKGHALGIGMRNANESTNASYKRNITVDILECDNCTVTMLDTAVKYASMDGTGSTNYEGLTEMYVGTNGQNATNNQDTINRTRWQNAIKAAAAITAGRIICGTSSGYKNIAASTAFDISYPLLYAGIGISSGGTGDNNYLQINGINLSSNGSIQGAANYATVYLKGALSGNTFTIASSNWLTCTVPTSADGFAYIPLGMFYNSTTNIYFNSTRELWCYKDGAFGPVSVREAAAAAKTATNYITDLTNGIFVAPEGQGPNDTQAPTGWRIKDALELLKNGVTYIKAWLNGSTPTVQIGASQNGNYALIDDDSFDIYHANTQMAHFGYGEGNADEGTGNAPYYTLGKRKTTDFEYSSSSTYRVGDHVLYNGVEYVCTAKIDTPKAFDVNDWQQAIGNMSVAEGFLSTASGYASHAEGEGTVAIGFRSHAEASNTVASGMAGHAEGEGSKAIGTGSHAEGQYTVASGVYSHAEGEVTTASGSCSHAQNCHTIAASRYQTAIGEFNVEDANDTYALIIGNGPNGSNRSNALAVRWSGLVDVAGANTAYPMFIWSTTPTNSSTFPVSPCFVYCTADNGLYYCTNN